MSFSQLIADLYQDIGQLLKVQKASGDVTCLRLLLEIVEDLHMVVICPSNSFIGFDHLIALIKWQSPSCDR